MRPDQPSREFILGIIAGEGTFGIRYKKIQGCTNAEPYAGVKMKNEKELITAIHNMVGVGNVYEKDNNMDEWQVWGLNQSNHLIQWIDETHSEMYSVTRKYNSYIKWKECIEYIEKHGYDCKHGRKLEKLFEMSASINNHFTSKEQLMDNYYQEEIINLSSLDT